MTLQQALFGCSMSLFITSVFLMGTFMAAARASYKQYDKAMAINSFPSEQKNKYQSDAIFADDWCFAWSLLTVLSLAGMIVLAVFY